MIRPLIFASCAFSTLAACGGGATSTLPFAATTVSVGSVPTVSDRGTDQKRLIDSSTVITNRNPGRDNGPFRAYSNDGVTYLEGFAAGETGVVGLVADLDNPGTNRAPAAFAQRGAGSILTEGRATYNGSYAGYLARASTTTEPNLTQSAISGTVRITADFDQASLDGSITNRQRRNTSTGALSFGFADVNLTATSFTSNGAFGSGTIGGKLDTPDFVPEGGSELTGAYNGVFSGDASIGAIGTVRINHDYINDADAKDDYVETGIYSVQR